MTTHLSLRLAWHDRGWGGWVCDTGVIPEGFDQLQVLESAALGDACMHYVATRSLPKPFDQ